MSNSFKRVCVVGMGYIGLPTAATLASRGMQVLGVDVSETVVKTVNDGRIHIVEPDLDMLVRGGVQAGNLRCSLEPEVVDAFIIAVPTPLQEDKSPDLSYIRSAAKAIAPYLEKGNLIVLESTSPVGTTESLSQWLSEMREDLIFPHVSNGHTDINIAHCPERVLPGHIMTEIIQNDRAIGGITCRCAERAKEFYGSFVRGEMYLVDARTAEMSKLTENAFRDVNIAFANELSIICDKKSINVWELIELANKHPRVNILQPGPGVGGHCIAVDPWFLVHSSPDEAKLINMARNINDYKSDYVVEDIRKKASRFKNPVIACLGLAFKPDIDDLRESPALRIARKTASEGIGRVVAVEPNITSLPKGCDGIELLSLVEGLEAADIVVALVRHKEFCEIDAALLKSKILLDYVAIC